MKLISITPQEKGTSVIYLMPDTALVRNNEAFYLPEFSDKMTARLALVIKVKKMGKKIAEHFAQRYYDEITAGLNLEAQDILTAKKAQQLPWDEAVGFDNSAPIGYFMAKSDSLNLTLECNHQEVQHMDNGQININRFIAEASQKFTLKIGDLIYITLPVEGQILEIGQQLKAMLNGENLLKCNIK